MPYLRLMAAGNTIWPLAETVTVIPSTSTTNYSYQARKCQAKLLFVLPLNRHPAVYLDRLAGDIAGFFRGKEYAELRYFVGAA